MSRARGEPSGGRSAQPHRVSFRGLALGVGSPRVASSNALFLFIYILLTGHLTLFLCIGYRFCAVQSWRRRPASPAVPGTTNMRAHGQ